MTALYNEIEPYAVEWLGNLAAGGHIADGRVDPRSIRDLRGGDVASAVQFHAFAGIGGWSRALRLAGWPDDLPVWTGSCPCQPFSSAGRAKGFDDDRHLWPEWFRLIGECRPAVVFGEQVASPDGLRWLDLVFADLEGAGYACGAADLCAAGVGAPHIRQRLFFVAVADGERRQGLGVQLRERGPRAAVHEARGGCSAGNVGDAVLARPPERPGTAVGRGAVRDEGQAAAAASTSGFWSPVEWLPCQDGRHRPVEPGTFPLADGVPARVGKLRGYGNAIVPQVAERFVRAVMEILL
jgi:DNA (cytosine-5)-methyltransferase 1